jgi:hypothetical protein
VKSAIKSSAILMHVTTAESGDRSIACPESVGLPESAGALGPESAGGGSPMSPLAHATRAIGIAKPDSAFFVLIPIFLVADLGSINIADSILADWLSAGKRRSS